MLKPPLLACALAALALPAAAADGRLPGPKLTAQERKVLDKFNDDLKTLSGAVSAAQACFREEEILRSDLAKKKAALAKEFGGRVPLAFGDLLQMKSDRIAKHHAVCFEEYRRGNEAVQAMEQAFFNIEPKSLNVQGQRAQFGMIKEKLLGLQPRPKGQAPARQ